MFKVELNKGGQNGPNFVIKRDNRFVGYLYNDAENSEDFEALVKKIENQE